MFSYVSCFQMINNLNCFSHIHIFVSHTIISYFQVLQPHPLVIFKWPILYHFSVFYFPNAQ